MASEAGGALGRERRWGAVGWLTIAAAGVSLAATVGSLPWMAYYFNICTPVSLVANLVLVPLSGVALMSSLASLLTGVWWGTASELYNHSAWLAMKGMMIDGSIRAAPGLSRLTGP